MHKFKYTSSTNGDKGITHVLQDLAEPALLSARPLALAVLSTKEDAGDVILQIQLSHTVSDGCFISGERLAHQAALKPVEGRAQRSPGGKHSFIRCSWALCALSTHFSASQSVTSPAPTGNQI